MLFEARSHYDHGRVAGNRLSVSSPRDCFLLPVPLGEPCPSLYKLEGRVTCGVLVGLGLVYLLLQVNYKFGSCFLIKEIFVIPFLLSRPIITWAGLLGFGPCCPSDPPAGLLMSRQDRAGYLWIAKLWAGHQWVANSGRVIPRGISTTLAPSLIWIYPC